MRAVLLTLLHLTVTAARLRKPGGVRVVVAGNLPLKQQLMVRLAVMMYGPSVGAGARAMGGANEARQKSDRGVQEPCCSPSASSDRTDNTTRSDVQGRATPGATSENACNPWASAIRPHDPGVQCLTNLSSV